MEPLEALYIGRTLFSYSSQLEKNGHFHKNIIFGTQNMSYMESL